eukprot:m.150756 g.150756  ORF g.150756 m.150756 type:complete len:71 (+) comp14237_c0_seq4:4449-4661(+)
MNSKKNVRLDKDFILEPISVCLHHKYRCGSRKDRNNNINNNTQKWKSTADCDFTADSLQAPPYFKELLTD